MDVTKSQRSYIHINVDFVSKSLYIKQCMYMDVMQDFGNFF